MSSMSSVLQEEETTYPYLGSHPMFVVVGILRVYEQHVECLTRRRNYLPLPGFTPDVFVGVGVAYLFSFLCCFLFFCFLVFFCCCFVCVRPMSFMPNVDCVSELSFFFIVLCFSLMFIY